MWASAECMFLYLETALHVGSGVQGGEIDLPIWRDTITGYPGVPSSSLKGSLRTYASKRREADEVVTVFGSPPGDLDQEKTEGLLIFSDASPLIYPVRSLKGLFAWITSPEVLAHWRREMARHGLDTAALPPIPELPDNVAGVVAESMLVTNQKTIVLEDLSFSSQAAEQVKALGGWLAERAFPDDAVYDYWRHRVRGAVVVLPEDAFRYFLEQTTPVVPRVRIDDATGTAAEGSLWNEEYLPPETLLYAMVGVQEPNSPAAERSEMKPAPHEALGWLKGLGLEALQIGGRRTLGHGLVQVHWTDGKE